MRLENSTGSLRNAKILIEIDKLALIDKEIRVSLRVFIVGCVVVAFKVDNDDDKSGVGNVSERSGWC